MNLSGKPLRAKGTEMKGLTDATNGTGRTSWDLLFDCVTIRTVISCSVEGDAHLAAVSVVDNWVASTIAAHLGTQMFPLRVSAVFTAAQRNRRLTVWSFDRDRPPEVSKWISGSQHLMWERLSHWVNQSHRFRPMPVLRSSTARPAYTDNRSAQLVVQRGLISRRQSLAKCLTLGVV